MTWDHAAKLLSLLIWPFLACISMGLIHGYAGLHVLRRGVIFVDLALAQMAALGAVAGMFFATEPAHFHHAHTLAGAARSALTTPAEHGNGRESAEDELAAALSTATAESDRAAETAQHEEQVNADEPGLFQVWPTSFALGGALLLAFGRVPGNRVPHEAIIGVVYVVAAATTVLLLSKSPHGHEQMEEMLTGKLLFVDSREVLMTAGLYAGLGVLHVLFYRPFVAISMASDKAHAGLREKLWDTLFYAMFALMVTRSVAVAGVLVVFSFLIIPGACASLLVQGFKSRIVVAWGIATIVSVVGMTISAAADLPSGPTVVATFGAALALSIAASPLMRRANNEETALAALETN